MVTGDFLLCQKKNVIIARCSSLHRTSALLVSALTDKSRNRCLMREPPPQYFCEVISKSLNLVTNSESLCIPVIICLSFYRQLNICFSRWISVQRWEQDSVFRFLAETGSGCFTCSRRWIWFAADKPSVMTHITCVHNCRPSCTLITVQMRFNF